MKKLFLICPDCYIEQAIRSQYGDESFFLTALATVFNINNTFEYAEEVNQFISAAAVGSIYIVNDINCTFIQNALKQNKNFNTQAEEVLNKILTRNKKEIDSVDSSNDKAKKLARMNIYQQAYELLDTTFIGNKIQDKIIQVYGLIYNRASKEFEEFKVDF